MEKLIIANIFEYSGEVPCRCINERFPDLRSLEFSYSVDTREEDFRLIRSFVQLNPQLRGLGMQSFKSLDGVSLILMPTIVNIEIMLIHLRGHLSFYSENLTSMSAISHSLRAIERLILPASLQRLKLNVLRLNEDVVRLLTQTMSKFDYLNIDFMRRVQFGLDQ